MNNSLTIIRQLVEEPKLVQLIHSFEADQIVRLLRHVGVEDAGDLIALASSRQLPHIFDEVFWKNNAPGEREKFDPEEPRVLSFVVVGPSQQLLLFLPVELERTVFCHEETGA